MSTKETKGTKETKVIPLNADVKKEQVMLQLNQEDAQSFLNIIGIILIGDDRLNSVQRNYIEMLKRNNEINS